MTKLNQIIIKKKSMRIYKHTLLLHILAVSSGHFKCESSFSSISEINIILFEYIIDK
jgi:hypothetical protein